MRCPRAVAAFLLIGFGLTGCGPKPDPVNTQPAPPAVPESPTQPAPPQPASTPGGAGPARAPVSSSPTESPPANPSGTIPPFVAYGQTPPATIPPTTPPPAGPPVTTEPATPRTPISQLPPGGTQLPPPPTPPKAPPPEPKEKMAGSVKLFEWPTDINGKKPADFIKDTVDLDPCIREMALRTLPNFGPVIRKESGLAKAVLARMDFLKEKDPGVRAAAFNLAGKVAEFDPDGAYGFYEDADTKEAVRLLYVTADQAQSGGATRLHAIETLAYFGPKAEAAIPYLTGGPATDAAYQTRRMVAFTLGRIAYHEMNGPNPKALACLINVLIHDHSASVRIEAMQSLVLLGPPLLPRTNGPLLKDLKEPPAIDDKAAAVYIAAIKKRLIPVKNRPGESPSPTGLLERDKQVEIYARLLLIRYDPIKELNEENLGGLVKYITGGETGPKLQALSVMGMLRENGAKRIDDVVKALNDPDPQVVIVAVKTLINMGSAAKPAIPALEKLKERGTTKEQKEGWKTISDEAIKQIKEAKPPGEAPPPAEMKKKQ